MNAIESVAPKAVRKPFEFFVPGVPQPKGSPSIMRHRGTGRPFVLENEPSRAWASHVNLEAIRKVNQRGAWDPSGGFSVFLAFQFLRPRTSKRPHPTVKPDLDKLARNVLDALTGALWTDDAQVLQIVTVKFYRGMPGVWIRVANILESDPTPPRLRGSRRRPDLEPGLSW